MTMDESLLGTAEVLNSREYPFSSVGLVSFEIGKHTIYGTGFLISKNVVLTSAQNLYCLETEQEVKNVAFIPSPSVRREK